MPFSLFNALKTRRRSPIRTPQAAKSRKPDVEAMEGRQLLSSVPYVLINSPSAVEGTGGSTTMNFTVTLSGRSTQVVSVNYSTANFTAVAGSDYVAKSGTLTFQPGETTKQIPVSIIPDSQPELTEVFFMQLSGAKNSTIIVPRGNGAILDDDTAVDPTLTIADVQMRRGLSGSRTMVFTVQLNTKLTHSVSVRAATSNVTAIAGTDYQAKSQVLTFNPGETTKQFAVTIHGSSLTGTKLFYVNLTEAGVPIARKTAAGLLLFGE